jgi:hypothetical protein
MILLTKIIGDKSVVQSQLGVAHATITLSTGRYFVYFFHC